MTDTTTTTAAAAPATAHEDIKANAAQLMSKIESHQATRSEFSTFLANAKSALQSAVQYIESDWNALVARLGGEAQAAAASPAPAPAAAAPAAQAAAPAAAAAADPIGAIEEVEVPPQTLTTSAAAADPAPAAAPASTDAPAAASTATA